MRINPGMVFLLAGLATQVEAIDFGYNGFLTVAGGTLTNREAHFPDPAMDFGAPTHDTRFNCPCFIADYNQAALYESDEFFLNRESRLGVQGDVIFSEAFSFTGQGMYRAVDDDLTLEWAFVTWSLNEQFSLQAGRKRIPLYYYSEFQDVGRAYIYLRPPQALYGWEASNYNGLSLRYQDYWGDFAAEASVFAGEEVIHDSEYGGIYMMPAQDVQWKSLAGMTLELNRDWMTVRVIYLQSDNYWADPPEQWPDDPLAQSVVGLAFNGDWEHWLLLTEFNQNSRKNPAADIQYKAPAYSVGAGYRFGKWTPFLNYARYWDISENWDTYTPERFYDWAVTLRYDINERSDIKAQVDYFQDESGYAFVGDSTLLSLAYNLRF